ncbi:hypothetical protein HMPREF0083_01432 [Aneurinibacillus aneurinilyticus ATCC 12856]|uniref:Uncharacterized protein n=1 Tax=Aneurinibacillus aneurinilyticus ATCC 12856 TaxID=649747 RepID=U1YIA5_ANEAE|nr:hypothetical protein HMPREF0083_01432 [Aneurinibacillus aneurinilyticus ATCC 12856]
MNRRNKTRYRTIPGAVSFFFRKMSKIDVILEKYGIICKRRG